MTIFYAREIGEGPFEVCDEAWYNYCKTSPHHDTKTEEPDSLLPFYLTYPETDERVETPFREDSVSLQSVLDRLTTLEREISTLKDQMKVAASFIKNRT